MRLRSFVGEGSVNCIVGSLFAFYFEMFKRWCLSHLFHREVISAAAWIGTEALQERIDADYVVGRLSSILKAQRWTASFALSVRLRHLNKLSNHDRGLVILFDGLVVFFFCVPFVSTE